jgi:ribosome-associated translation inhibitor RaiA
MPAFLNIHSTRFSLTPAISNFVRESFEPVLDKFRAQNPWNGRVVLAMENSPQQAGPDSFLCHVWLHGKKSAPIVLNARAENLYAAIRNCTELLMEKLSRQHKKERRRMKFLKKVKRYFEEL